MRIGWDNPGTRLFETGLDRGVLYPRLGPGVPWSGLVTVSEGSDGGDLEPLYFEGVKYADVGSSEDFKATIEAFGAPAEFAPSDGVKQLLPGLFVTQQPRTQFGLSYRTLIGNDLISTDYGYKLHVVYNCMAAPSAISNKTIGDKMDPDTRSWDLNTVPPPSSTFKPTAHLVVNSTLVDTTKLNALEDLLYGNDEVDAYLPTIAEIVDTLS